MKVYKLLLLVAFCATSIMSSGQITIKPYALHKEIANSGDGGWDYINIDVKARRVYCSHGDKVVVIDADSDKQIAEITGQNGVHGIAIAKAENKGFISNSKSTDVGVFDLKTNQVLARLPSTGKGVDAISYNTVMHYVLVHNARTHNVTVIDAKTNKVVGTVDSVGKTEAGVSDDKGFYYVNAEDEGKITKIDLHTLKVVEKFNLAPDNAPAGLSIDVKNHLLFCGARSNHLVIVDYQTGKIVTTVPICDHNDTVFFDPETKLVYVSCLQAELDIFQQKSNNSYLPVQQLKTKFLSKTMTLDNKTKKIYMPSATFDGTDEKKSKMIPATFKVLVFKN